MKERRKEGVVRKRRTNFQQNLILSGERALGRCYNSQESSLKLTLHCQCTLTCSPLLHSAVGHSVLPFVKSTFHLSMPPFVLYRMSFTSQSMTQTLFLHPSFFFLLLLPPTFLSYPSILAFIHLFLFFVSSCSICQLEEPDVKEASSESFTVCFYNDADDMQQYGTLTRATSDTISLEFEIFSLILKVVSWPQV